MIHMLQQPTMVRQGVRPKAPAPSVFQNNRVRSIRAAAGGNGSSQQVAQTKPEGQLQKQQPAAPAMRSRQETNVDTFRRMSDYMNAMQRDMDSLMDTFMPGMSDMLMPSPWRRSRDVWSSPLMERMESMGRELAMEVQETDKEYVLTAMVPGFSKNEIKITLGPNSVLTIKGEHTEGEKGKRFQSFTRQLSLPDHVDVGHITAKTEHGVLVLQIPKVAPKEPQTREIPLA